MTGQVQAPVGGSAASSRGGGLPKQQAGQPSVQPQVLGQSQVPVRGSAASSSGGGLPKQQAVQPSVQTQVLGQELQEVVVDIQVSPEELFKDLSEKIDLLFEKISPNVKLTHFQQLITDLNAGNLTDFMTCGTFTSDVRVSEEAFQDSSVGIDYQKSKEIWDALKLNGFLDENGKIALDENGKPKEIAASNLDFIQQENLRKHVAGILKELSNCSIFTSFMIRHRNYLIADHGPSDGQSMARLLKDRANCPVCRVPINKIITFREYLNTIKQEINNLIKDKQIERKEVEEVPQLIDQLIQQCSSIKIEDIQPPADQPPADQPPADQPPGIYRVEKCLSLVVIDLMINASVVAASLHGKDNISLEEVGAKSLLILASLLRLGGSFVVRSENSDCGIRGVLPEIMIFTGCIATISMMELDSAEGGELVIGCYFLARLLLWYIFYRNYRSN